MKPLRETMRIIAMARVGVRPKLDAARASLGVLRDIRDRLRDQHLPEQDLAVVQAVLQRMAHGYMPEPEGCIMAVRALADRLHDKKSSDDSESPNDHEHAAVQAT